MKTRKLLLIAVAGLAVSCTETDLFQKVESVPGEIAFSTFENKVTKAENSGETDTLAMAKHHTSFVVWAAKNAAGSYQEVWDSCTVSYSSNVWTPAKTKYWDKAASNYYFYAAAPANASLKWGFKYKNETVGSEDYSEAYISLKDFVLKGTNACGTPAKTDTLQSWKGIANDIDVMIASPCPVSKSCYDKETPDQVDLVFNHILSRLNVLVKKGIEEKVTLDSIMICNLKNCGTFKEDTTGLKVKIAEGTSKRWTSKDSGTYVPKSIAIDSVRKDSAVFVLQTLIIPQEITYDSIDVNGTQPKDSNKKLDKDSKPYLKLCYRIDGEKYVGFFNLAAAFKADKTKDKVSFNEGWQNNLTITLGDDGDGSSGDNGSKIVFDVVSVYNWDNATPVGEIEY